MAWDDAPPPPEIASKNKAGWDSHPPEAHAAANEGSTAFAPFLNNHPTVKNVVKGAIESLPAIGSVGGEVLAGASGAAEGLATGGAASIPLAISQGMAGGAAGGIAGSALKSFLEQNVLGIKKPVIEQLKDAGLNGLMGAAQIPVGKAIVGAAKSAAPMVGAIATGIPQDVISAYMGQGAKVMPALLQSAGGNAAEAAKVVQTKIAGAISSLKGTLEDPALQIVNNRATSLSNNEAGGAVKQLITQDIKNRNGVFTNAYGSLDQANQSLPLSDEGRSGLTQGLKSWALENYPNSSDTYKLIQKHSNNIDASNTGAQFKGAMQDLSQDLSDAYKNKNFNAVNALTEVQNRANQFWSNQIRGLANKVSNGSASDAEMSAFNNMAAANNVPAGEDIGPYAKQIANDYLKNEGGVDKLYSGFKDYMNTVQQQTGAKKNWGAMTLIKGINDVPNEKLIDNMFKPENAEMMSKLKTENPEVFNQIASVQIRDLAADSTNKAGSLDMTEFHNNVMELPKEIRSLMFSPQELETLRSVANNPKLMRLNELTGTMDKGLFTPGANESSLISAGSGRVERHSRDLLELSRLTGQNLLSDAQNLSRAIDQREEMLAQQKSVEALKNASPRSLLTHSGIGAAAGFGLGEMTQSPVVGKVAGTLGGALGALSSPYALKTGINMLQRPTTSAALGAGVVRGGAGVSDILKNNVINPSSQSGE